jgi:adenylyltransferase/sulfurtransferase
MVKQIRVQDLAERLARGDRVHLVDVREPWEHATASLPNSTLLPLGQLEARLDEIDVEEGTLIVAYCHHGVRSLNAAHVLEHAGHKDVASLAGGIDAWSQLVDPKVPRY